MTKLFRITAPYFCAGVEIEDGVVVEAAPILAWMIGKPFTYVKSYCTRKSFSIEKVNL